MAVTIKRVQDRYNAQSFRSFIIRLDDERKIPVHKRDLMMIAPSGSFVVVCQPDGRMQIVDLDQIADLKIRRLR